MSSNIMPGRFRDRIQILEKSGESDEWGVSEPSTVLLNMKGNVYDRTGDQLAKYGTEVETEIITVLTYYREAVRAGQQLNWLFRGGSKVYEIKNVKNADNRFKSMIITAEIEKHIGDSWVKSGYALMGGDDTLIIGSDDTIITTEEG